MPVIPAERFSTSHVDYLQRTSIDISALSAHAPTTSAPPDFRRMSRVRSIGHIEKPPEPGGDPRRPLPSEDLLIGLHGEEIPLAFLVLGTPRDVAIHLGTWSQASVRVSAQTLDYRQEILKAALNSLYPAIELSSEPVELTRLPLSGLALGIPTAKPPDPFDGALPLDRLIRALSGTNWACLVLAEPVDDKGASDQRNNVIYEVHSVQAAAQAERAESPLAAYYTELLTATLESGLEAGLWRTGVYLMGDRESYYRLASVWRGIFSDQKSLLEPVRVWDSDEVGTLAANWALPDTPGVSGPGHYRRPLEYQTLLTSTQLAAYVHLPRWETSGFMVRNVPDFDVVPPSIEGENAVSLGEVVLRTRPTGNAYATNLKNLTRHTLVAGVTGSGKTNTVFHMLKQAADLKIPFLVLEPAKAEYRELLDDRSLHGRLQIFTLGNEEISPFRLNPFEVVGWPTTHVGVHIDLLRSVFSASFGMWTPLPQILERCLHAVYKDRGWDIASNTNYRLDSNSDFVDAFPTLAELVNKAEEILPQLRYEASVEDNMRTALLTRLNGLRAGTKGPMLDVQRSLPMNALLERPTILELQDVGDDDDKAFLMGLLLIRLCEYRRAGNEVPGLQHLIVIEEAHRLLTNVGARRSEEEADPRAKAVETFANLLSEIRAYGQGVIVVDQIPVKLAPEIMKNTNLKIAHRVVSADDRMVLAGAMAMNERQALALATLTRGQAAVFSEGDDAPILVQVPPAKDEGRQNPPDDRRVIDAMSSSHALKTDLLEGLLPGIDMSQPPAYTARNAARTLADDPTFRKEFVRLVVSITEDDGALDRLWTDLKVRARTDRQGSMDEGVLLRSLVIYASAWFAHRRGSQAAWSYADTAELEEKLRGVLLARLDGKDVLQEVKSFRTVMQRLHSRPFEPFPGCAKICTQSPPICLYRRAVADLISISKEDLAGDWKRAYLNDKADGGRLQQTWLASRRASDELVEWRTEQREAIRRVRLCFAQHMLSGQFLEDHKSILDGLIDEATKGDGGQRR